MSYQVYDENGFVGDFATTKGLNEFMKWCESTEDIELDELAKTGMCIFPMAIRESLEEFDPPIGDIKKTYDNFLELLSKCSGIVIVSDGINDDLEEIEEE